ncbi:MAG: efflux RND transporter periplasmic adaptor subunit [Proteobacteria bacterium]|nr:efflux RND transporter periplasmic adaptor subunit [Pseudomonadota bacterium]
MRYAASLLVFLLLGLPGTGFSQEAPLVVKEAYKDVALSGYTRADTTLTLSAEVSGKVTAVHYQVGDRVGEKPFYEIDPTFIDFQIRAVRQSMNKLDAALEKARSLETYLNKEFVRIDTLHKGDRATGVKRDEAQQGWDQARLQIDTLLADKAALQVDLDRLAEQRRRHEVFAPKGWMVVYRMVEAGEVVNPQVPLARVGDFGSLVVPMCVSNQEFAAIVALGETFPVSLDNEPGRARVNQVNPEFNEQTRKRCIELAILDFGGEHLGGLECTFTLTVRAEGALVPKAAVISRYENPRVRLAEGGESLPLLVLGESGENLIVAETPRLPVGTALAPAQAAQK